MSQKNKKDRKCKKCSGRVKAGSAFDLCQSCLVAGLKTYDQSAPPRSAMVNEETRAALHAVFGEKRAEHMMAHAQKSCQDWFRLNPTKAKELIAANDRLAAAIEAWFDGYVQCAVDMECTSNRPNGPVGMS